jgi:hypothetical protein
MGIVEHTVSVGGTAVRATTDPEFLLFVRMENETGSDAVYAGTTSAVSSSDYAFSVLPEAADRSNAVTIGPFPAAHIPLHELWFVAPGGTGATLHVVGVKL